jgi:hypothetical protein
LIRENKESGGVLLPKAFLVFASKPPSRKGKSGAYEYIGFMGSGFGGWVADEHIPSGHPAFV